MNDPVPVFLQHDFPVQFRRESGGRLQINPEAVKQLNIHKQISPDSTEAGGILLGRYVKESTDIVIDSVTQPSVSENRTRNGYYRTSSHHQAFLNDSWKRSNGVLTYLGDWHTHPQRKPIPSVTDMDNWNNRLEKDYFTESLFFLILGTQEISIWEGKKSCNDLQELRRILWPAKKYHLL